jgi:phenylpropionate dioxygenase-like ring-hydroxylating dioxygenase large terminal subunit
VLRDKNRTTQPVVDHPVFTNWDVIAHGWYIACRSADVARGRARSVSIGDQRLVVFRGDDGKVRALDAFCAHMGTDLAIGRVVGNTLRCAFHHWRYDETGACIDAPCANGERPPSSARVARYDVTERHGFVWVFPAERADARLVEHPELEGKETIAVAGARFTRKCHHHVNMVNGIDPQHLKTVHALDLDMSLTHVEDADKRRVDFVLSGPIATTTTRGRIAHWLLGGRYGYAMRYGHASVGLLTIVKDVDLFGRFRLPTLHMIYAYRVKERGVSEVQPIYVAEKRPGLVGALVSRALMLLTRVAYHVLKDEDGAIYDHIRFQTKHLLAIDAPLAKFVAYVNRLTPSAWSRAASATPLRVIASDDDPPRAAAERS